MNMQGLRERNNNIQSGCLLDIYLLMNLHGMQHNAWVSGTKDEMRTVSNRTHYKTNITISVLYVKFLTKWKYSEHIYLNHHKNMNIETTEINSKME